VVDAVIVGEVDEAIAGCFIIPKKSTPWPAARRRRAQPRDPLRELALVELDDVVDRLEPSRSSSRLGS
jgi:hypothetical protein